VERKNRNTFDKMLNDKFSKRQTIFAQRDQILFVTILFYVEILNKKKRENIKGKFCFCSFFTDNFYFKFLLNNFILWNILQKIKLN